MDAAYPHFSPQISDAGKKIFDEDFEASIALARQLQQEESLRTWSMLQSAFIHDSRAVQQTQLTSGEDVNMDESLALALKLAREEQRPVAPDVYDIDLDTMSYDQILCLQDQIGDVKQEQWIHRAETVISETCKLATCKHFQNRGVIQDGDKCLICQHDFHSDERILQLPCGHLFHHGCSHEWLSRHDTCPLCKKSIQPSSM